MATQRRANDRRWATLGRLPSSALIGLVAIAYFGIARAWLAAASGEPLVAAVWVPAGLGLAAAVGLGYRVWPAIALGAFAAHATADASLAAAAGLAAGYTVAAVAGAYVLQRAGFDADLRRSRDVLLLAAVAVASTAAGASIAVATLWATGGVDAAELWREWRAQWLGDLSGVLIVAPAVVVPAALGLPIALASLRFPQVGAVLAAAATTALAVVVTAAGEGPLAGDSLAEELLETQVFAALVALAALSVAAWRTESVHARAAVTRLAASERALSDAQRVAQLGSWEWEIGTERVLWSDELYRLFGLQPDAHEASYSAYLEFIHPEDRNGVEAAIQRAVEESVPLHLEHRIVRPDGEVRTLMVNGRIVSAPNESPGKIVGTAQDVTEHRVAEARFRDLLESAPDAMVILDEEGEIMLVNSQTEQMFGYSREELLGESVGVLIPEQGAPLHPDHPRLFPDDPPVRATSDGDQVAVRKDGTELPVDVNFSPLRTAGQLLLVGAIRDVSERKIAERRLEHMALHDHLTGLPNRTLFLDRLDHALARSARPGSNLAVFFCDIDNFKKINDGLGHEVGDELLTDLPDRINQALRAADTVARFGGDEFVILCEDLESEAGAIRIAERIGEVFRKPFLLDGNEHYITVSVGVVFVRGGQASASEVLRDADLAMYRAKARGRGRFELFDAEMRARVVERLELEKALRRAVRDDELTLVYQPVVSLRSARFVSVEALVRWQDPDRGLLAPPDFIDIAEESGLIVPIGGWVIQEACRDAARWSRSRSNADRLAVSINLSPRQVSDASIVELLGDAIETTGVDPSLVELEVTERALIEDSDAARATLNQLKGMGVRLILDDFGTGHSSLSRLKRFPIDALKIDGEFIAGLADRGNDTAIVSAVLSMAWALEVDVIAEGVETVAQLDWLSHHGCRYAQGFLIAPPLSVEQLAGLRVWARDGSDPQPAR